MKKSILLFLALLLPALVFVFLKFFGKNEFAVEPLFQDTVQVPPNCSGVTYTTPYTVADSVLTMLQWSVNRTSLIIIEDSIGENQKEQRIQMNRVFKEFSLDPLNIVMLTDDIEASQINQSEEMLNVVNVSHEDLVMFRNCVFLLDRYNNALLIDSMKRVVGQYDLTDREDTDRLMLELKIVFKKY